MEKQPSYGSRRLSKAIGISRPRAQRVIRIFGIKPYRRRGRKRSRSRKIRTFPNLLRLVMPSRENHVWATDFTELVEHGRKAYVATVIDLYTREVRGLAISRRKGAPLTIQVLSNALLANPPPEIFHSDNGREYEAHAFIAILEEFGIKISRSRPGAPWENGYQESLYDKFKVTSAIRIGSKTFGEQ